MNLTRRSFMSRLGALVGALLVPAPKALGLPSEPTGVLVPEQLRNDAIESLSPAYLTSDTNWYLVSHSTYATSFRVTQELMDDCTLKIAEGMSQDLADLERRRDWMERAP